MVRVNNDPPKLAAEAPRSAETPRRAAPSGYWEFLVRTRRGKVRGAQQLT